MNAPIMGCNLVLAFIKSNHHQNQSLPIVHQLSARVRFAYLWLTFRTYILVPLELYLQLKKPSVFFLDKFICKSLTCISGCHFIFIEVKFEGEESHRPHTHFNFSYVYGCGIPNLECKFDTLNIQVLSVYQN